jgi:protein TonB
MAIYQKNITNLPVSILAAIALTIILFVAQPLLVKFSVNMAKRQKGVSVIISQRKPPPPPELEKEDKLEEVKKQQEVKKSPKQAQMARPKIDMPAAGISGAGLAGTIAIGNLLNKNFKVSDSLFVSAFNLNEVDQPPRVLRALPPRYPFEAKQKGISGKVVLRFVVDANGNAQEPQVVSSEPKGVFDEAALEAVVKYKFRPAKKGGKAVDCIVKLPIVFSLNE